MILIVDSGSTKSALTWIDNSFIFFETTTKGINPFYQNQKEIEDILHNVCCMEIKEKTSIIYFYGAGCAFKDKIDIVKNALTCVFQNAHIEVNNDLLGASRALFNREQGIACILGTGSNSCLYNGKEISYNVPPLGFILGDEGSGAVIGKRLIGDILKGIAPQEVVKRFYEEENIAPAQIMEHVYKKPFPNRFLACFSKHVYAHREETYFQQLIFTCFSDFFARNINQYPTELPIGFIGSIAYYFSKELKHIANLRNRTILKIEKDPIKGLINFHSNFSTK